MKLCSFTILNVSLFHFIYGLVSNRLQTVMRDNATNGALKAHHPSIKLTKGTKELTL